MEPVVAEGHAEGGLPVGPAGVGVAVAPLGERREVGDAVRQPEALRTVGQQDPYGKKRDGGGGAEVSGGQRRSPAFALCRSWQMRWNCETNKKKNKLKTQHKTVKPAPLVWPYPWM